MTPTHKTPCMTENAVIEFKFYQLVTNDAHHFLFDAVMNDTRTRFLLAQHYTTEAADAMSGKSIPRHK